MQLPDLNKATQEATGMANPGKLLTQFTDAIKPASFLSSWSGQKSNWLGTAGKISSVVSMAQSVSSLIGFLKPGAFKSGFNVQNLLQMAGTAKTMLLAVIFYKMTRQEILKFIEDNQVERITDYNNKLYSKIKDLNQRNDRLTLFLIVIVFIYFLTLSQSFTSILVGPISIKDLTVISKLIPVLFAYFLLEFALLNGHRAEVMKTVKWIHLSLYKQEPNKKDYIEGQYSPFVRLLLPFSRWTELYELNNDKPLGCIGIILLIPMIIFLILPFYFEYISIKFVFEHYWNDWIGKISIILSTWIMLITLYHYIKLAPNRYRIAMKEKTK